MSYETSDRPNAEPRIESISSTPTPQEDLRDLSKEPSESLKDSNTSQNLDVDVEKEAAQRQQDAVDQKQPRSDLVVFDGPDDPGNPQNFPTRRKIAITVSGGLMTFVVTFASSVFSTAIGAVAEEYHVGTVVSTLGVSLFLLVRPNSARLQVLLLTSFEGLRVRTGLLRPCQRGVWSSDTALFWLHHLRHLPDTRGGCSQF